MKIVAQRTATPNAQPFDLAAVMAHVRVEDESEQAQVESAAFAAASDLEHFAQLALLTQTIQVQIIGSIASDQIRLPIGPLSDAESVAVTVDGQSFSGFEVITGNRPVLILSGGASLTGAQRVTIEYTAGFGDNAASIPADLSRALMDQAALHYDGRSPMDAKQLTNSPHMARIGARYRGVQL
jgi:uncharacterized phiE125 gp8 family phage protein